MQDYHLHSYFSGDSQEKIENIIEAAKKTGMEHIIITDHVDDMDTTFANDDTLVNTDYYIETMKRYSLPAGVEYSWDGKKEKSINLKNFDFVILSYHGEFETNNDQIDYLEYLSEFRDVVLKVDDFHVLGHLDLPRRYDKQNRKFDLQCYDLIRDLFKIIIEKGKGIEVNMKGVSLYGQPNPDWDIVKLYKDCGGDFITIGSDAHIAKNVGRNITDGLKSMMEIGFDYLDVFHEGKWTKKKIKI